MNGYLVVVEGDYFGSPRAGDRKKEKYPYRIQVKVPSPEGALSLIKNKLLDKVLRRNYANFYAYRTHQLVSITNLDGSKVYGLTDPRLMDFNDLAEYVKNKKLPLKLELYTDLGYFRTMVYLAETNQREFLIKQADLAKDSEEDKLLAELNPELMDTASQPLQPSVPSDIVPEPTGRVDNAESPESPVRDTIITEAEQPVVDPENAKSKDGQLFQTVDAPASNMITEDKPQAQSVDKVYIPGKGFVDVDNFKEDFDKEDEKEFETYDPKGIGNPPESQTPDGRTSHDIIQGAQTEVQAEPDDPAETELNIVDEL